MNWQPISTAPKDVVGVIRPGRHLRRIKMKIEKLKPGMIVYGVGRTKMGNTTMTTVSVWPVRIISVDLEKRSCIAVWNMVNKAQAFYERSISKWREKEPKSMKWLL